MIAIHASNPSRNKLEPGLNTWFTKKRNLIKNYLKMFSPQPVYCDLNILDGPSVKDTCEQAFKLGYMTVAINKVVLAKNCVGDSVGGGKRGAKKRKVEGTTGTTAGLPPPSSYPWMDSLLQTYSKTKIVHRLTVIFGDVGELQAVLNQSHAKLYTVIAVVPTNHEALQNCLISTTLIFDIVSFDLEGPHWINKIRLNRQKGKVAADKEINFEIPYAPSLHGDEPCENMIYLANRLTEDICTRRIKNIVISSGASMPSELRSPKDVASLGYLLGMDETTTRFCVKDHCCRTVAKAEARKFGKTWVAFVPSTSAVVS